MTKLVAHEVLNDESQISIGQCSLMRKFCWLHSNVTNLAGQLRHVLITARNGHFEMGTLALTAAHVTSSGYKSSSLNGTSLLLFFSPLA